MTHDPKCHELASKFLADEPAIDNELRRWALAEEIQGAIENFLEYYRRAEKERL